MRNILNFQKTAAACIVEIIIGILLLIDPVGLTNVICSLIGLFLLLRGVWSVARYFRAPATSAILEMGLGEGLVLALVGLFLIFGNGWLLSMGLLSILTMLYGVLLLVLSLEKVQWAVDRYRIGSGNWGFSALDAGLTALLGIIIVANPWMTTEMLWIFIAVSMIVSAGMDLAAILVFRCTLR